MVTRKTNAKPTGLGLSIFMVLALQVTPLAAQWKNPPPLIRFDICAEGKSKTPPCDYWDYERSGWKDENGKTIIRPLTRYINASLADTFYTVIAVLGEKKYSPFERYYMNRYGKKFGRDSLWYFEFDNDVEREGFIRFSTHDTTQLKKFFNSRREGVFKWTGEVAIPPLYDHIGSIVNGYTFGTRNGYYVCDEDEVASDGCEHPMYKGGETVLLNTSGRVLVENLPVEARNDLDIRHILVNPRGKDLSNYIVLKGNDGKTYAIRSYRKHFKQWTEHVLKPILIKNDSLALRALFYDPYHPIRHKEHYDEGITDTSLTATNEMEQANKRLLWLTTQLTDSSLSANLRVDDWALSSHFELTMERYPALYNAIRKFDSVRHPLYKLHIEQPVTFVQSSSGVLRVETSATTKNVFLGHRQLHIEFISFGHEFRIINFPTLNLWVEKD